MPWLFNPFTSKLDYYADAGTPASHGNESHTSAFITASSLPNVFGTIAVAAQSSVVADSTTDTLTLVAGANVTITTNATSDEITIAAATDHAAVTVTDTDSINLTLTGQEISGVVLFGTSATTACVGNDARLSNDRNPTSHTHAESEVTGLVNDLDGKQIKHGFVNKTSTTLAFDNTTHVFTLGIATTADVYVGGAKLTLSGDKTVDLDTYTLSVGQWFIWLTAAGALVASKTSWSLLDTTIIPVVTISWDGTAGIVGEERHSASRNLEYHYQAHTAWGSQYISGFTPTPTFGIAGITANTFSFVGGVIADEDIQNSSILNDTNYVADGNLHKHCQVAYRAAGGATMAFDAVGTGYAKLNAGALQYDNAGTLASVTDNNYGILWIYATNHKSGNSIISVVGQGNYASVAACQAASQPALAGMSAAEWKLLYRVICRKTVANPFAWIQTDVLYNTSTGPAIGAGSPTTVNAASVTFIPSGNVVATNVQAAVEELDSEKLPTASFTDAAVTGKLITGYTSGAGTVAATDTVLQAINKLDGNDAAKLPLAGGTLTGPVIAAAATDYTTAKLRNVFLHTRDPVDGSDGNNGDIWIKYTA